MPTPSQALDSLRRGSILTLFLAPFLVLGIWSIHLIRNSRGTHHELDHCNVWNREIIRHREAFEFTHKVAGSLVDSPEVAIKLAAADAASAAFQRSRETLGRMTHGEPDTALEALDLVVREYRSQVGEVRQTALDLSNASSASDRKAALIHAQEAAAHLEHRRQDVIAGFQELERRHQARLDGAIQASLQNAKQLSLFAGLSLLVAFCFGIAATIVLRLKRKAESASRFAQTLVDTLPEGLLVWGRTGVVLKGNAALAKMIGQSSILLTSGLMVDRVLPPSARLRLERCEPGARLSFNLTHAGGRMLAVEASMGVIEAPSGVIHIAVIRDTSRATEAERRSVDNRRMAELGQQMAGFCRDLERVIHPVLLSAERLKRAGDRDPDSTLWGRFDRSLQAAEDLIKQIVRFANREVQPEQSSTFDMNACVQEVVESFLARGTSLNRFDLDLASLPAMVGGPKDRFMASLELLVFRALEVTSEGLAVKIRTWDEDGFNCLEILDPGDDIPASEIERVFDPVYITSNYSARTGFALFNVASTIQGMGGRIEVNRLDGAWTRFLIQIPQGW
jgi:signal transduction histidine kinase